MNKIYFSAPLFNQAEKDFNLKLTEVLEKAGYEVFLPQRDGLEAYKLINLTQEQKSRKIFEKDIQEIEKADIIFMVLDGRVPDDGACVELGYAYALGKRCYGVMTDTRSLESNLKLNPLISGCFIKIIFDSRDGEAIEKLQKFLKEQKL